MYGSILTQMRSMTITNALYVERQREGEERMRVSKLGPTFPFPKGPKSEIPPFRGATPCQPLRPETTEKLSVRDRTLSETLQAVDEVNRVSRKTKLDTLLSMTYGFGLGALFTLILRRK